jgi:hypothetical protein
MSAAMPQATRLQLIGLQLLARKHNRMLDDLVTVTADIIGEPEADHAMDFIFDPESVDLDRLWEATARYRDVTASPNLNVTDQPNAGPITE